MSLHENLTLNHKIERYIFATVATMNASTGYTVANIGQVAFVTSTTTYYRLNAVDGSGNPTWLQIGGGGGSATNLTSGLVSYYRFDETGGGSRADAYGSNNLTVAGGVSVGPGKIGSGNSYSNNGAGNGYLYIGNGVMPYGPHDFTVGGWIYQKTTDNMNFWSRNQGGGGNAFQIRYSGGLTIDFSNPETQLVYSGTWTLNQWNLVIVTYDHHAQTMTLIVNNGTPQVLSTSGITIINGTANLQIGQNQDATNWTLNGYMDGWFFYLRTLNSAEYAAIWNSGAGMDIA